MKHYFLVALETKDGPTSPNSSDGLQNEIFSNLQSVESEFDITDATVTALPELAEDLKTLQRSTQDATPAIECVAALANFSHDLLHAIGEDPHADLDDADLNGETNLDKFTLAH